MRSLVLREKLWEKNRDAEKMGNVIIQIYLRNLQ